MVQVSYPNYDLDRIMLSRDPLEANQQEGMSKTFLLRSMLQNEVLFNNCWFWNPLPSKSIWNSVMFVRNKNYISQVGLVLSTNKLSTGFNQESQGTRAFCNLG